MLYEIAKSKEGVKLDRNGKGEQGLQEIHSYNNIEKH